MAIYTEKLLNEESGKFGKIDWLFSSDDSVLGKTKFRLICWVCVIIFQGFVVCVAFFSFT